METYHENHAVRCTVDECEHHCPSRNFCSLDCVTIGTHEADPRQEQCTDCKSFRHKKCL